MIDKKEIGKRIILVRKYLKLNQVAFSKEIEVTQQTISQIETGVIAPSLEIIYKITGNYGISYDWLITGEGSMLKDEIIENGNVKFIHNGDGHNIINHKAEQLQISSDLCNIKMEMLEKEIEMLKGQIDFFKAQNEELKKDKDQLFAIINRK